MFSLISILESKVGKYAVFAGSIIVGLMIGWTLLKIHDSNERESALVAYNVKQMEQSLQNQKQMVEKLTNIMATQETVLKDLNAKNAELDQKLTSLDEYLNSPEAAKSDKGSSEILKNTIRGLATK